MILVEMKNFEREGKRTDRSMSGLFENFEKRDTFDTYLSMLL